MASLNLDLRSLRAAMSCPCRISKCVAMTRTLAKGYFSCGIGFKHVCQFCRALSMSWSFICSQMEDLQVRVSPPMSLLVIGRHLRHGPPVPIAEPVHVSQCLLQTSKVEPGVVLSWVLLDLFHVMDLRFERTTSFTPSWSPHCFSKVV